MSELLTRQDIADLLTSLDKPAAAETILWSREPTDEETLKAQLNLAEYEIANLEKNVDDLKKYIKALEGAICQPCKTESRKHTAPW